MNPPRPETARGQPTAAPVPVRDTVTRTSRVISDVDELAALRDDWARLRTDVPGATTTPDWVLAHARALRPEDRFCGVAVFEGGRMIAFAPLTVVASAARHLAWLHTGNLSAAYYGDASHLPDLMTAVFGLRRPIRLAGLVPGSPTERALLDHRPPGWIAVALPWLAGPSLALDDTWVDPIAKLSAKRRSDMRRTLRKAEALGDVRFDAFTSPPPDEVNELFEDFLRIEASGWKGAVGTALEHDAPQREGLRRYLTGAVAAGPVRITRMRIGEDTAAIHLNAIGERRSWGLKAAVHAAYMHASPGLHLMAFSIGAAAEEGCEYFEFMGATAPFKEMWGGKPNPMTLHRLYPPNAAGVTAVMLDGSRRGAKKLARWSTTQTGAAAERMRERRSDR